MTTKPRASIAQNDGLLVALSKAHDKLQQRHQEELALSRGQFGRALKAKRTAAFVELHRLAKHINVPVYWLEAVEAGRESPPLEEKAASAEKFIAAAWKKVAKP